MRALRLKSAAVVICKIDVIAVEPPVNNTFP